MCLLMRNSLLDLGGSVPPPKTFTQFAGNKSADDQDWWKIEYDRRLLVMFLAQLERQGRPQKQWVSS